MRPRALWLPGDHFLTSNKLLDLLRAEGYYTGVARERGEQRRRGEKGFAAAVKEIRDHANMHARAAKIPRVPEGERIPLIFVHYGSGRRDPSSWYLSAKAIEDGLVDAEVIGSDRSGVSFTAGSCVKASEREWQERAATLTGVDPQGRGGMLVLMEPEVARGLFG